MVFLATNYYPVEYTISNLVPKHRIALVNADLYCGPHKTLKKKRTNRIESQHMQTCFKNPQTIESLLSLWKSLYEHINFLQIETKNEIVILFRQEINVIEGFSHG